LKQFLQNLFERVGLAEAPMPPLRTAEVSLAEPPQMRQIFLRLVAWGVKQVRIVAGDAPEADDIVQTARQAAELGMSAGVRGRASVLASDNLLAELSAAGVREIELPLLSAIAEVHDTLAGMGDYRCAVRLLDTIGNGADPPPGRSAVGTAAPQSAVQLVLAPSTWKTIERTLEYLADRGLHEVRVWAVACRNDEPSSWALSANELIEAATRIEAPLPSGMDFTWYPPLRFDPARTLAQQIRRGPRAARDSVRIEADGSVVPPIGPPTAGGNISQNDWKPIARSEVFRAWKRRREAAKRCEECPGLAACSGGCLRDEGNWVRE
jgi:radical SAM protein with 4Fe4S-binding SPASM domain